MDCTDCVGQLTDYLEGLLDERQAREVEEHFTVCPSCRIFFQQFQQTLEWTHEFFEEEAGIPDEMKGRLVQFLHKINQSEE